MAKIVWEYTVAGYWQPAESTRDVAAWPTRKLAEEYILNWAGAPADWWLIRERIYVVPT